MEAFGLDTNTVQAFLDQANRILQGMLSSAGLLALLVASVGIANTMLTKYDQWAGCCATYSSAAYSWRVGWPWK